MISVDEALQSIFALCRVLDVETVDLRHAANRVLAQDAVAQRAQPPFASSAMDGYGVRDADAGRGNRFKVIGEAAAGHEFSGTVSQGEAVRIFTGAPVPAGVDRVIIQEDVTRDAADTATIIQAEDTSANTNIRPMGGDFSIGDTLAAGRRLSPQDVTLLAAMNIAQVRVYRRPVVALIATGDELVMPGEDPGPSQIIASNSFGIAAMVEAAGGIARILPIAPDNMDMLRQTFTLAEGADVIVSIGGASVGDHDLVGKVCAEMGLARSFYKVAMRPGKPLMAGQLGAALMLGLPGNPVSSLVTARLFLLPALAALQGLPKAPVETVKMKVTREISANGPRAHYMRAKRDGAGVAPFDRQDSALMSILSTAHGLIVLPPNAPATPAGSMVDFIPF